MDTEYTVTFKWQTNRTEDDVIQLAKEWQPRDLLSKHNVTNWLESITREEVVKKTVEVYP